MSRATHHHHRSEVAAAAVLALSAPGLAASAGVRSPSTTTASAVAQPAAPPTGLHASPPPSSRTRVVTATRPRVTKPKVTKPKAVKPKAAKAKVVKPEIAKAVTPRKAQAAKPKVRATHPAPVPRLTGWPALDDAIAGLPEGPARSSIRWVVTSRYGHLGTTDLATATVYISPAVPSGTLPSVVRHEYSHVVSVRAYDGQWQTAVAAMNRSFGGASPRGMGGAERAADCMARALGASWFGYTSCTDPTWRAHAAQLLSGRRL